MFKFYTPLLFFVPLLVSSQNYRPDHEHFPVFDSCESVKFEMEEQCFIATLKEAVLQELSLPDVVREDQFSGEIVVLFEVDSHGNFQVIYIDAPFPELKEEIQDVFQALPRVKPGTYNGRPIDMQFRMPVRLGSTVADYATVRIEQWEKPEKMASERPVPYDSIQSLPFENKRATSGINIPFSHELYSRFEDEVNQLGSNFHTASKPFVYQDVAPYYDFEAQNAVLAKDVDSWLGRKIWNEHLFRFQGEDYWFSVDFGVDLQVGKDFSSDLDVTYNNTRAAIFQGGLGNSLNFYSVIYESQGRFADYYNRYAISLRPGTEAAAVVPGRGVAKAFMGQAFDYPVAEGYLSFTPNKFFTLQAGHGKHFIGDGYRSILLSDNAAPYPFVKLSTTFWKIRYTNTWMSLRDIRPEVTGEGSFRTKYMANHYLSYNVTKRLNIGFFESVMWEDDNNRGVDWNYLNPIIFYRAIEFATGHQAGNAIIGLTGKFKWSSQIISYGQWLIDEFSSADVFGGAGSWKNKHGFQIGTKFYDAFGVPELHLRVEYNQVRPYTYSHNTITLNYGHSNQSMAHLWGANFKELLGIVRYRKGRYYGMIKGIFGLRGFDYNTSENSANFGGDIFRSEIDRPRDTGVEIGQGNTVETFFAKAELGYLVNPTTNLKFFGSLIYRNFDPQIHTAQTFDNETLWLNFGLRTDIFNWYYDY